MLSRVAQLLAIQSDHVLVPWASSLLGLMYLNADDRCGEGEDPWVVRGRWRRLCARSERPRLGRSPVGVVYLTSVIVR